jgi:opacity protein-like surface antigen
MWKVLRLVPFSLLVLAVPAAAQTWSFGAGTGPFIFGKFMKRTQVISNGESTVTIHTALSAKTRPGLAIDLGRDFNDWLGLRLEGTWTEGPLRLKSEHGDNGVNLTAGNLRVTTFSAPLVVSLNRHGAFRFQLFGGPACAIYDINPSSGIPTTAQTFEGTRQRWGFTGGAGVQWWWSDRFAAEGRVQDIVTSSPIERSDTGGPGAVDILRPHNVHTTVGIRYRF